MGGMPKKHTRKNKKAFGDYAEGLIVTLDGLHRAGDLSGTQAAGAGVHTLGGTINDRLNTTDVGLPATVGPSVRVGHTNAESNTLTAVITLCHCSAPPFCHIDRGRIKHSFMRGHSTPTKQRNYISR